MISIFTEETIKEHHYQNTIGLVNKTVVKKFLGIVYSRKSKIYVESKHISSRIDKKGKYIRECKIYRLVDPTTEQIYKAKQMLTELTFSDYFYKDKGQRAQLYFLADYAINKYNQIQLRYYNEKPLNPICYYEDVNFDIFINKLVERLNTKEDDNNKKERTP